VALDIIPEKIKQLNNKISPIEGTEIEDFLANKDFNFTVTLDKALTHEMGELERLGTEINRDHQEF